MLILNCNRGTKMFENEQRKGKIILPINGAITSDEENVVRKNVHPKYFDVEKFIEYLNTHEYIDIDIFNESLKPNNDVGWTYLNYLRPVSRDVFIKRIPIYFYDLYCDPGEITMTTLFNSYKEFETGTPMACMDVETLADEKLEQIDYDGFDFRQLYETLDDIVYVYKIPIHLVLQYLKRQCGDDATYWVFDKWYNYIKLVQNLNEENVFPRNILYSYNVELVNAGQKPIIYMPFLTHSGKFVTFKDRNRFTIGGYFPVDEKGNVVEKWTGVWIEDSVPVANAQQENMFNYNRKTTKPSLKVALIVKVGPETTIYAAKHAECKTDVFGDEQSLIVWEPVYIGTKKMVFDYKAITQERERIGASLKALSEATDINLRTLQRIENGGSNPDGLNLIKIMDYLNIESYEAFIKKTKIYDPDFEKFESGQKPSYFIQPTDKVDDAI